jgi:hypothetical protein
MTQEVSQRLETGVIVAESTGTLSADGFERFDDTRGEAIVRAHSAGE